MRRLGQVINVVRQAFRSPYFGFVQGHAHLRPDDIANVSRLVGMRADNVVADFERKFAKLVGQGEVVSYAAARMGFYELMKLQEIGKGDEVILLGATCAVMANAVMRTGATPVFSDIDQETLGSSRQAIEACISHKTRMIVAQHSFGIPCNIEPIAALSKSKNIFLLEDCALTLGSKVNGITVGNYGDAAIFSTDHSKPLNTLIGGLVYTQNAELAGRLRLSQANCADLSVPRQKALWKRFLLEANNCIPTRYGRMGLIEIFSAIWKKIIRAEGDFLLGDSGPINAPSYPYPAKLPAFLAAVGLLEAERWSMVSNERTMLLKRLLDVHGESRLRSYLPSAYKNKTLQIIPLRFAWFEPEGVNTRRDLKSFIHVTWTWFMAPVIATHEPLENLGYYAGACPTSEHIGPNMVNLPCNISPNYANQLITLFKKTIL